MFSSCNIHVRRRRPLQRKSPLAPAGPPSWTVLHDDRPLVAHLAGSYSDEPMMGADATASTGRTASFSGGGGAPSALLAPPSNTTAAAATAANTTVQTLEDGVGLTAHSMGLSAEQDTELLASFRSAVINETNNVDADIVQVCAGDRTGHRPPVHFSVLRDDFDPFDNIAKNAASDRIEAAVAGHADTLVRLYFRHVHPVYPVVSKTRFLRAYARDKTSIPASLRGAIYGLASNFWAHARSNHAAAATVPASSPSSSSAAAAAAHSPLSCSSRLSSTHTQQRGFNQHELFEDALGSLQREFHGPNLWVLQASLLLIHETPADNATIESPRVWMLASQAVACAQMIGLHRDPTDWAIAPWEKALRRKLWWATFATDVWSSVSHGNPPHIYPASFTTPALSMDDLSFDEDVPPDLHYLVDATSAHLDVSACARFFEGITVARLVHNLLLSSLYVSSFANPLLLLPSRDSWLANAP
ncbi:hypothetical protein VTK73DRAFT_4707 [Phialemonium thermophilum]|uniref:Xylanolytic transcriptional activator regulatory domain-containing protein n=1 Tax=Phialemonium thermophilum TaxID=223376 RepID=A0ABR3V6Q0_9PEZI